MLWKPDRFRPAASEHKFRLGKAGRFLAPNVEET